MRLAAAIALGLFACGSPPKQRDIEVTVYLDDPVEGATVWFQDSVTGEITDVGLTDSSGVYWGTAPNGATVSAAIPFEGDDAPSWFAYSLVGVEVGERVWLGDKRMRAAATLGAVSITLPGPFPDARDYQVSLGCKGQLALSLDTPVVMDVDETCVNADGNIAIQATVYTLGVVDPVAYTPTVVIPAPSNGEVVSVEMPAYDSGMTSFDLIMTGLDSQIAVVRSELSVFRHGVRFETQRRTTDQNIGTELTHRHTYVAGPGVRLVWRASLGHGNRPDIIEGVQVKLGSTETPPASDTIDRAELLPVITTADGRIGLNESPELEWDAGGEQIVADGLVAHVSWPNPSSSFVSWTMLAPTDGSTRVVYPDIPDELELMRGIPGFFIGDATVFIIDAEHIAGYEQFRLGGGQETLNPGVPTRDLDVHLSSSGDQSN